MKKKIYVFGNPLVEIDRIPSSLMDRLKYEFPNLVFEAADPNENFPPEGETDILILDTVVGIKEPIVLDIRDFEEQKKTPISPHDYDLLLHLLLLKKMGKIDRVRIIGIPVKNSTSLLGNEQRSSCRGQTRG